MITQLLKHTHLFPRTHMLALAACSFLVLLVSLWPAQGQSVVVNVPATVAYEDIAPEIIEPQFLTVTETVESGDTLSSVFERSGAGVSILYRLISNPDIKKPIERIFPGQQFTFKFDEAETLKFVSFNESPLISYDIQIDDAKNGLITKVERTPDIHTKYATATITDSLFLAGMNSGLSDNMIMQLATVFGWDIDFALDIREGDTFSLLY